MYVSSNPPYRWDWHAWQLLIGLLPAAGEPGHPAPEACQTEPLSNAMITNSQPYTVVAGIAYWARKDMEKVFGATLTYVSPVGWH